MKVVAKVVIVDNDDMYLLMRRSEHPRFPNDPDLPGGTLEEGEEPRTTMLREVEEEAGIRLDLDHLQDIYEGDAYSVHKTKYYLYIAHVNKRPDVTISWEHASYEWVSREKFLEQTGQAADTYMHMVYDVISRYT